MTIFQMECFSALAASLNFTQTANQMFITQPALSRIISSLEQELNVSLLLRTTHSVALTPAGKVFARDCKELLKNYHKATEHAISAQQGQIGSICIGFQRDTFDSYVVDFVNGFKNTHSDIVVEMQAGSPTELLRVLLDNEVDAVVSGALPPSDSIEKILLASRQECVVLPLNHPFANRTSITMEELKNEKFIVMARSASCGGYDSVIQKSIAANFEAQIIGQVDLVPTLMTLVACGQGISLLQKDMMMVADHRIAFVPLENVPSFKRWLMWDKNNENPCLKYLIEHGQKWQSTLLDEPK